MNKENAPKNGRRSAMLSPRETRIINGHSYYGERRSNDGEMSQKRWESVLRRKKHSIETLSENTARPSDVQGLIESVA